MVDLVDFEKGDKPHIQCGSIAATTEQIYA